jgi:integrase/recombinase XerC
MSGQPNFPESGAFTAYLQFEKRYSAHTIRAYTDDLSQLADYLLVQYEIADFKQVKSSHVRSWLAHLKENNTQARTINRKISSIKTFCRFLLKTGAISQSPLVYISSPKAPKRLPVYVEQSQMETLLSRVEFSDDWKGHTEYLVILLLYHTGMRLSELLGIKTQHIDLQRESLKVLGKGNKERILPLTAPLKTAIEGYIRERGAIAGDEERLLINEKGRPLYAKAVYLIVKKHLSLVTTLSKKSPHVLRHSFATHLSNNGAELNPIKELLGHASLAATQVYTHNTIEKLKDIHKKAHPKA